MPLASLPLAVSLSLLVPQDVPERVTELCRRSGGIATAREIGTSRGGRPIVAVELAGPEGAAPESRSAVLVVAGVHGGHPLTTELALHHAARLVDGYGGDERTTRLLDRHRVLIVPRLNPDGAALGRVGNARPLDRDRDGRSDEDGPNDLDGDGVIAQMRWRDPDGELVLAEDPRLLREADASKGERGAWMLAVEGRDDDGDGARDEDPAQGVALHRGFAHDWPEFEREAGAVPMGEPETRALADWVLAQRGIALAVVHDVDDTLLGKPKTDAGEERVPLEGVLEGDAALFEAAGERYRDITGREGVVADRHDGSVWSWLYCDAGIPTFASDVWRLPAPEEEKDAEAPSADALQLQRCEELGRGFVAWHEVEHPELGTVEVGGFVHGSERTLLAEEERQAVLDAHHEWLLEVAGWLPRCHIADLSVEQLADGVWQIEAAVANEGRMPALTAIGAKSRRFSDPRLALDLGGGELVAGRARVRAEDLGALGDRREFRWIVAAPAGTRVRLELEHDFAGRDTKEVTL